MAQYMSAAKQALKALPVFIVGVGVPVLIAAASIPPDQAISNLSKWAQTMGVSHVPTWLANRHLVGECGVIFIIVYSVLVWGVIPYIAKRRARAFGIIVDPTKPGVAELVIEYSHSSASGGNGVRPLVVRNVTPGRAAFNVSIASVEAEHGEVSFTPEIITCIEGGAQAKFYAKRRRSDFLLETQFSPVRDADGSFVSTRLEIVKNDLPKFLKGFDKAGNAAAGLIDLSPWDWKRLTLEIHYESSGVKVVAECELMYRHWQDEVKTGAHYIRIEDGSAHDAKAAR